MAAVGVDIDADTVWREYRWGSLCGVIIMIMASMGAERTERGDEMFRQLGHRHAQQAIELDAISLLS